MAIYSQFFPVGMVIFNSYVQVPEGKPVFNHGTYRSVSSINAIIPALIAMSWLSHTLAILPATHASDDEPWETCIGVLKRCQKPLANFLLCMFLKYQSKNHGKCCTTCSHFGIGSWCFISKSAPSPSSVLKCGWMGVPVKLHLSHEHPNKYH